MIDPAGGQGADKPRSSIVTAVVTLPTLVLLQPCGRAGRRIGVRVRVTQSTDSGARGRRMTGLAALRFRPQSGICRPDCDHEYLDE